MYRLTKIPKYVDTTTLFCNDTLILITKEYASGGIPIQVGVSIIPLLVIVSPNHIITFPVDQPLKQ